MYSRTDLRILDPLDAIRSRPELFLVRPSDPLPELFAGLTRDALARGADRCHCVARHKGWSFFATDKYWASAKTPGDVIAPFESITAMPDFGELYFGYEAVVNAFSSRCSLFLHNQVISVSGESVDQTVVGAIAAKYAAAYVIAFSVRLPRED